MSIAQRKSKFIEINSTELEPRTLLKPFLLTDLIRTLHPRGGAKNNFIVPDFIAKMQHAFDQFIANLLIPVRFGNKEAAH